MVDWALKTNYLYTYLLPRSSHSHLSEYYAKETIIVAVFAAIHEGLEPRMLRARGPCGQPADVLNLGQGGLRELEDEV